MKANMSCEDISHPLTIQLFEEVAAAAGQSHAQDVVDGGSN
jgi:hypothetical protein